MRKIDTWKCDSLATGADKLANIEFTTNPAQTVHVPIVNEVPLSQECEIVHTVTVGSHMQVTGINKDNWG